MGNDHDAYRDFVAGVDNRRGSSRYATNDTPTVIGWLVDGAPHSTASVLKNLSVGGASVETKSAPVPPTGTLVLLSLADEAAGAGTIEAAVVAVEPPRPSGWSWFRRTHGRATWRLRLMFSSECPYEFYKAAVGVNLSGKTDVNGESEGFNPRDWR